MQSVDFRPVCLKRPRTPGPLDRTATFQHDLNRVLLLRYCTVVVPAKKLLSLRSNGVDTTIVIFVAALKAMPE